MSNDKSIEELLRMVTEEAKPSSGLRATGNNKNVLKFIQDLNIETGTVPVPSYLIFYYYRLIWDSTQSAQRYKTSKTGFFATFHKHFVQQRKSKQRYYLIKEGIFDLSSETLKKADEYDRSFWAKKKAQEKV
jgi:hypothetical protein